jgi:NADPH:quinone reductase-like Zn-dependent oxidoreductase
MKAVRLAPQGAGYGDLRVLDEDMPSPGHGEVLVRIRAASLNPHDDFVVRGVLPAREGVVPLTDGAGEVAACGEGVDDLRPGDAVVSVFWPHWEDGRPTAAMRRDVPGEMVDGFAREYTCLPARAFLRAPKGLGPRQAATLPCAGVTAWRALVVEGGVRPGDTVLVLGSGAVSLFALQFAKMAGARVIATSSSPAKLDRLRRLGADDLVDYTATPDWAGEVRRLTDGRGVDHIVEVGGPATLPLSIRCCRIGGHVAVVGVLSGFTAQVDVPDVFANQIRLSGVSIGSRADQRDMIRAIEVNGLEVPIERSFDLGEIREAFEHFAKPARFGKVCIEC